MTPKHLVIFVLGENSAPPTLGSARTLPYYFGYAQPDLGFAVALSKLCFSRKLDKNSARCGFNAHVRKGEKGSLVVSATTPSRRRRCPNASRTVASLKRAIDFYPKEI